MRLCRLRRGLGIARRAARPAWGGALRTAARAFGSTRDEAEVAKFGKIADMWWDEDSAEFGALHSMNSVRVPIIAEAARACRPSAAGTDHAPVGNSLEGLHLLDVGCGGGILSEALGRLGGRVLGIDASHENVTAAAAHAALDPALQRRVSYRDVMVEDLAAMLEDGRASRGDKAGADAAGSSGIEREGGAVARPGADAGAGHGHAYGDLPEGGFDVVVSSEVVEHVSDASLFVRSLARCLRPGGAIVMTTITRTPASYAGAIVAAERITGLVPRGTHDFAKFLLPSELASMMQAAGLTPEPPEAIAYNPLTGKWSRGGPVVMQYALSARKA